MNIYKTSQIQEKLQSYEVLDSFTFDLKQNISTLFAWLKKNYQSCYENNQRLVIEIFCPVESYKINLMIEMIDKVDISRFFICIITDQHNVIDKVSSPIGFDLITVEPIKNSYTDPTIPNLCAHAWAGFWLWPDGSASVCCLNNEKFKDEQDRIMNVSTHNLDEIFQSKTLAKLRKNLKQGLKPKACKQCWMDEDSGKKSRRQLAPYVLDEIYYLTDWDSNGKFMYLGGHLGNICNLSCRICSSWFSSQWTVENIKHGSEMQIKENKKILSQNSWPIKNPKFWNDLKSLSTELKAYEFLGGEPFLINENIEFFEWLIDQGLSQNCVFRFTTNGTKLPDCLLKSTNYRRLEITFSVDDIGDRFEYQRTGAHWKVVEDNIRKMCQIRDTVDNIKIGINSVISIMNVLYLPEILLWIDKTGVDHWHYVVLDSPYELSIKNLPISVRKIVVQSIQSVPFKFHTDIQLLENFLLNYNDDDVNGITKFLIFINHLDTIRNQDFTKFHKCMYDLLIMHRIPPDLA